MMDRGDKCRSCGNEQMPFWGATETARACQKCRHVEEREIRKPIRSSLIEDIWQATERCNVASDAFLKVVNDIPSGLPHPDGFQRIKNASRELASARESLRQAHRRMDEFVKTGVPPQ